MVFLIGPMGAGKSTIGRHLAARLHMQLFDLDALIVERAGMSIPDIFTNRGEEAFRKLESNVLESVCHESNALVSTGGGIVLKQHNRELLKKSGMVIWLDAMPEVLAKRVQGDRNRPLLHGVDPLMKARELDAERRPLYRELADLHIDTAQMSVQQAVDAIDVFLSESGHE